MRGLLFGVSAMVAACGVSAAQNAVSITAQARLDVAIESLRTATTDEQRFYALNDAAKQSFVLGNVDNAARYARDLTKLLPMFQRNWNYGNAVQDVNLVFGRIAVQEGRLVEARRFLLAAGNSPGSPQMNSFGPNMSLALDLLGKGEREVVLEYFELCRRFWSLGMGRLDSWSRDVKAGAIPDFGANLIY